MADKTAGSGSAQSGQDLLKKLTSGSTKGKKGLPKRIKNTRRKDKHKASWVRAQERKQKRREAQAERERVNRQHRQRGEPTPAEQRYRARRNKRRALALIALNGCEKAPQCSRPKGHKGKHGKVTQTELAVALYRVERYAHLSNTQFAQASV